MTYRLQFIDILRGFAFINMVIYHMVWDLAYFGYFSKTLLSLLFFQIYQQSIVFLFLFLSGFSLYLAHNQNSYPYKINWPKFLKRFFLLVFGAFLITTATYIFFPKNFIYFGILHALALYSLIGLFFLSRPFWLNFLIGLCVFIIHYLLKFFSFNPFFSSSWLFWSDWDKKSINSFDLVPFFLCFSYVLFGIASAQILDKYTLLCLLKRKYLPKSIANFLKEIGKRAFPLYLIHQLILFSVIYAFSYMSIGKKQPEVEQVFFSIKRQCEESCTNIQDIKSCQKYCSCVSLSLKQQKLLYPFIQGSVSVNSYAIQAIINKCQK